MTDTEIKVNGKQAGTPHQGAFYRFKREITKLVHMNKENLLEVKVNKMSSNTSINEAERQCDFGYSEAYSVRFTSKLFLTTSSNIRRSMPGNMAN